MEPIAITGFAFKLPQGAEDENSFWEVLERGRNVMTAWPTSRVNINSFYQSDPTVKNTLNSKGAHFLSESPAAFDAPFFSITSKEAASMDPQQRLLLETTYHALENAGIPVERVAGTDTAVYGGCATEDYMRIATKDPDEAPTNIYTGTSPSILANRLSWYFDLKGPSIQVDTACSSSMIATHIATQSLQSGQVSMALVTGSNIILSPEHSIYMSSMKMLSPDSLSYSFDHRANGYARGEGIIVLVLKRLRDAIRDGDRIRAIIRATGTNQDGHTPGLTQPSQAAQEELIRSVYRNCNLGLGLTRYIEAHGTGTQIGDLTEAKAIGRVFRTSRSPKEPLYIGSLKANFGHLEGASGLASILKCIMILEKGVIPQNALFEKWNPKFNANSNNIQVPTSCIPWPNDGLRRVSVNPFGIGGSNGHLIMDDAFSTLEALAVNANRHTMTPLSLLNAIQNVKEISFDTSASISCEPRKTAAKGLTNGTSLHDSTDATFKCQLLVWSAKDEAALKQMLGHYTEYFEARVYKSRERLSQLAYTLATRRSTMTWRSFAVMSTETSSKDATWRIEPSKGMRVSRDRGVAFVFTGQGAQYARMGLELMQYPIFKSTLVQADVIFRDLGAEWSMLDELQHGERIDTPQLSQPLCTGLQIALFELLVSFGIVPYVVIGHSSGEIAAAYAVGALSIESACKIAYHRGRLVGHLIASMPKPSEMISVNLPEREVDAYLDKVRLGLGEGTDFHIDVACINSPSNVTLSGDKTAIDKLKRHLDRDEIFAQKLKTGVGYHSPAMEPIAEEYLLCLGSLEPRKLRTANILMVSSVTSQATSPASLSDGQYWVDNLLSPVRFTDALQYLVLAAPKMDGLKAISHYLEIGPHSALRRPINDTLSQITGGKSFRYSSVLSKFDLSLRPIMDVVGQFFVQGYPVNLAAAIQQQQDAGLRDLPVLVDLPKYPFDHSQLYWHETRISRDWRLRAAVPHQVLGVCAADWNPLRPRWKKTLSIEEMPWIADHVIGDAVLFPATGTIMMALEAVKQMAHGRKRILGFHIKEAIFSNPIVVRREKKTEVSTHLIPLHHSYEKTSSRFEIQVFAYADAYWNECFKATIHIEYDEAQMEADRKNEVQMVAQACTREYAHGKAISTKRISKQSFYSWLHKQGLMYGEAFSLAEGIHWDGDQLTVAHIDVGTSIEIFEGVVHPAVLDAACQISYVAPSSGMSKTLPTIVPHKMQSAWVSAIGWQHPHTRQIRIATESKLKAVGTGIDTSITVLADDGSLLCHIQRLEMLSISSDSRDDKKTKLLHRIEWKPQLSLLNPDGLRDYCNRGYFQEDENSKVSYFRELDKTLRLVVQHNMDRVLETDRSAVPSHIKKYIAWMENQFQSTIGSRISNKVDEAAVNGALEDLKLKKPSCRVFIEVAQNLIAIVRGEVNAHELLASTTALQDFHDEFFSIVRSPKLVSYWELSVHQNAGQKILELGANMRGKNNAALSILQHIENRTGGSAFSEYTYTEISAASLDEARERLVEYEGRIIFKVFDFEKDMAGQELQPGTYDTILAGNVLHTSINLSTTLQNLRRALKPGGRLIFHEITAPDPFITNFGFGILPGWWCGEEEYRTSGPTIMESEWDLILRDNGFSGNDLVIQDHQDVAAHYTSVIISTAEIRGRLQSGTLRVVLVVNDEDDGYQRDMATSIANEYFNPPEFQAQIYCITGLVDANVEPTDFIVFLADLGKSLLANMSKPMFELVKAWVQQTKNLLWITWADTMSKNSTIASYPYTGMKDGLLRTLQAEFNSKHIVSLSLEGETHNVATYIKNIFKVFDSSFRKMSPEIEYCVRNGQILTPKLVEDIKGNLELASFVCPEIRKEPWLSGPPLKLDMATRGQLETLHFSEDSDYEKELGSDDVEIESKAWAVNFRDMFGALGRLDEEFGFGSDCAGIVTRVGPQCRSLRPGDRVCMCVFGCMRTYPRAREWAVIKIPDSLSFEEACAVINPACTSWQSLVEVARLQKGEKVLIHSAAGATGQLAIQIAQMVGAEVFATVGHEHKKQLLMDQYNLPADHIFYSRNVTFASGVMRVTGGYGVDVVLNSLVGEGLRASWECIAPHGRFVEIGKADINANSSLPMSFFAKNVSFAAIDLRYILLHKQEMAKKLLHNVMKLAGEGHIHHPKPLHIYDVCAVENAFRYFQSGTNTGRTVIRVDPFTEVEKHLIHHKTWNFDGRATYLIAGGLGGIGRSMIRWMARKGAKHLIVPSRSGVATEEAIQVVAELSQQGVTIVTPQCDISSLDSVSQMLEKCRRMMPEVRGCINATMVLQDTTFDNMTYEQWESSVRAKVPSSWNLHTLLPDLDFFILLSSVSGIIGNVGQANYAAGCTFQDSLARYRACNGQKAISIDLGPMGTVGVVAETESLQQHFENSQGFVPVQEDEFLSLLDMCCDPTRDFVPAIDCQVTMGLPTPTNMLARSLEPVEFMQRPLFAFFSSMSHTTATADNISAAILFQQLTSAEERAAVVVAALAKKLARALSMKAEDIDTEQPLHNFGVDSLVGVELRNWIAKEFAANIAVYEITGGKTIAAIGELVTKTTQMREK